jgi:glutamate synthase (NADPH/NADH) large chain/glutamate synthase (ferredoxin)
MRDQLEELDEGDSIELRALIDEHAERTGSPVAQRVLDRWEELRPKFVKVFPADYKRVLAERAAAERAGDETLAEADVDG